MSPTPSGGGSTSLKRTDVRKFSTVENFLRMRYNYQNMRRIQRGTVILQIQYHECREIH